ncbi:DUF2806 domain-containing protein [Chloroflexota bacterium]
MTCPQCRIISDDDMQMLWSRILAGESNSPGTYSKRTINALASFDKVDAELFTKLCSITFLLSIFARLLLRYPPYQPPSRLIKYISVATKL